MTLVWLAVIVVATLFVASIYIRRGEDNAAPEKDLLVRNRRVTITVAIAALAVPLIAFWPLRRVTERGTNETIAWTGASAADPTSGLVIGGGEDGAAIGWPNSQYWPRVRVSPIDTTRVRLTTYGGYGFVRSGEQYLNGVAVNSNAQPTEIDPYWLDVHTEGWFSGTRFLRIRSNATSDPIAIVKLPDPSTRWVRPLGQLLALQLFDLRSSGKVPLSILYALEQWAANVHLLILKDTVRVLTPNEESRVAEVPLQQGSALLEVLWPGQRLVSRIASPGSGIVRLSFESPWLSSSPLPPVVSGHSVLTFSRFVRPNTNTFLLPLGEQTSAFQSVATIEVRSSDHTPHFVGEQPQPAPGPARRLPKWLGRFHKAPSVPDTHPAIISTIDVRLFRRTDPTLQIALARAGPDIPTVVEAVGFAWLLMVIVFCVLWVGGSPIQERELWYVACLFIPLWTLLNVRILLALRYVLDPRSIDDVTVNGLAGSLAGLVIVPCTIGLGLLLWADYRELAGFRMRGRIIATTLVMFGGAMLEYMIPPRHILPTIPERFLPILNNSVLKGTLVIAGIAMLSTIPRVRTAAASLWRVPHIVINDVAPEFWKGVADASKEKKRANELAKAVFLSRAAVVWGAGTIAIIAGSYSPWREYFRQIIGPFWLIGIPALLLLAAPVVKRSSSVQPYESEVRLPILGLVICTLSFIPAAVALLFFRDMGAIYAVVAFHLPLALIILLSPSMRVGRLHLAFIVAGVALAYVALLVFYEIAPDLSQHILGRVEVMRYGQNAQDWLLDLERPSEADATSVSASNVRNALVHEWEHMAMTRRGGFLGLGFGEAPVEHSLIRLDTIEYDSVFSFFIVGEFGFAGGAALLIIYAASFLVLLVRSRAKLRTGDVLGITIAGSFFGEAIAHAAMNSSQLWFTGRNLPLLATSSPSDLLRWALLFGLVTQTLLWQSDEKTTAPVCEPFVKDRDVYDDTFDRPRRRRLRLALFGLLIITPVFLWAATGATGWLVVAAGVPLARLLIRRRKPLIIALPMGVVAILLLIGWTRAIRSDEYDVFTWSRLLDRVDALHREGKLVFDASSGQLLYNDENSGLTSRPTGRTWLEAEVLRFNAMPLEQRLGSDRAQLDVAALDAARNPSNYYTAIMDAWREECLHPSHVRPSVIAVERLPGDDNGPGAGYRVMGNPRYNVVHAFQRPVEAADVHTVTVRNGTGGTITVIAPAWVRGHYTYAVSPETAPLGLGWLRHLASALDRVPLERRTALSTLTIDVRLQRAAQTTADFAGRALHGRLLAAGTHLPLPPRVAMTIMKTTNGETLALAAWPRASALPYWTRHSAKEGGATWEELEPPSTWIDGTAPAAIVARHFSDHNLTAIEMGSATKPFWATGVLAVRPALSSLLIYNGTCDRLTAKRKCIEETLFGRQLQPGWRVSARAGWVGFDRYLAFSDNRYETRLGMLGFASVDANGNIRSDGRGPSGSNTESLNGQMNAWNHFPAFPSEMRISRVSVATISNLHQQPVAHAMRDLFGVNTGASGPAGTLRLRRLSMWSGQERDDVGKSNPLDALAAVSPDGPSFALQRIASTRSLIAVLLGGSTNRWSNVQAAGAFASCSLGRPVVPHVVAVNTVTPLAARTQRFNSGGTAAAQRLRPGLSAIFDIGTAAGIHNVVENFRRAGYDVYGKSGTLASTDPDRPTSRLLMTIVEHGPDPRTGVTISLVAERADEGFATATVGAFLRANQLLILEYLRQAVQGGH